MEKVVEKFVGDKWCLKCVEWLVIFEGVVVIEVVCGECYGWEYGVVDCMELFSVVDVVNGMDMWEDVWEFILVDVKVVVVKLMCGVVIVWECKWLVD